MDETLDEQGSSHALILAEKLFIQGALSGLVVKPSVIGGHEEIYALHKWTMERSLRFVISSAFEGPVGISTLSKLAASLDEKGGALVKGEAHGLGTLTWFSTTRMEEEEELAWSPRTSSIPVDVSETRFDFRMVEAGPKSAALGQQTFVFLHGFLGSCEDWIPIMRALVARGNRCIAIDLPGHGLTTCDDPHAGSDGSDDPHAGSAYSIAKASDAILSIVRRICSSDNGLVLVGYSLGARISLATAIKSSKGDFNLISRLVLVSGSAGLTSLQDRQARLASDDRMAKTLCSLLKTTKSKSPPSLAPFLHHWYSLNLWDSLRHLPSFDRFVAARDNLWQSHQRQEAGKPKLTVWGSDYAAVLKGMSPGQMEPMWDDIASLGIPPTCLVVGGMDHKYEDESRKMLASLQEATTGGLGGHQRIVIQSCGHAVHVEKPLALLKILLGSSSSLT